LKGLRNQPLSGEAASGDNVGGETRDRRAVLGEDDMAVKLAGKSRRTIIGALAGSVLAGLLSQPSKVQAEETTTKENKASEGMSLAQAQYQNKPKGIYCCATCSLFEPPKSCKVVAASAHVFPTASPSVFWSVAHFLMFLPAQPAA
jgi:hypothetical protein